MVGEDPLKWEEGYISGFQKKNMRGIRSTDFPTIDETDETHLTIIEIEPFLLASGCRI